MGSVISEIGESFLELMELGRTVIVTNNPPQSSISDILTSGND